MPFESPLESARDQLVDALLREHARLDGADDNALIGAVLARTTEKPAAIVPFPRAKAAPPTSPGDWCRIAAAVALTVAGALFLLSRGAVSQREPAAPGNDQQVFRFVTAEEDPPMDRAGQTKRRLIVSAEPVPLGEALLSLEEHALFPIGIEFAGVDLSAPDPTFERSILRLPASSKVRSTFVLACNESKIEGRQVTYTGDVVLQHAKFVLRADSLSIREGNRTTLPVLAAENASLVHAGGAFETAADNISYDPGTGKLVATGVRSLVSHGAEQPMGQAGARVVFEEDGDIIEGPEPSP